MSAFPGRPPWDLSHLKGWGHNRLMSNVGLFFFFCGFFSIFACGLRFSQQTLPCIFFRWFALRFRKKTYAKKLSFPSGIFWRSFVERETIEIFCFAEQ